MKPLHSSWEQAGAASFHRPQSNYCLVKKGWRDGWIDRWMGRLIKHIPNDSHVTMNMHHCVWAIRVGVAMFTTLPPPHTHPLRTQQCVAIATNARHSNPPEGQRCRGRLRASRRGRLNRGRKRRPLTSGRGAEPPDWEWERHMWAGSIQDLVVYGCLRLKNLIWIWRYRAEFRRVPLSLISSAERYEQNSRYAI